MTARAAVAAIVVAAFAASGAAARPLPPQPDSCATNFHPGPYATSCPFTYGGGRVLMFGATHAETEASITIEVVLEAEPNDQVLATCTRRAAGAGPLALPAAQCVARSPALSVAPGTVLRCRHRGPGNGVFGCFSP